MSFSHQLFHGIDLDGLASDDALHLRILALELLEPSESLALIPAYFDRPCRMVLA